MFFRLSRLRPGFRAFPIITLLVLTPLLTACDEAEMQKLLVEMALEWAEEKDLVTVADDGEVNVNYGQIAWYGLIREKNKRWGGDPTTGDEALDAALDIAPVALSIRSADKLAREGMDARDPSKLDDAIKKRPHDWNYYDQKASILAANGDQNGALAALSESEALVDKRIEEGGSCRGMKQNMLRGRIQALEQQLKKDPKNNVLGGLLQSTQNELFALNNNQPDSPCP
jgi:hypothetical protein